MLLTAVQRRGLGAVRAIPFAAGAAAALVPAERDLGGASTALPSAAPALEVVLTLSVLAERRHHRAGAGLSLLAHRAGGCPGGELDFHSPDPTAVHLPGEVDPGLVGDWRGLYGQKNTAGAVCAMTALLFLFTRNGRYNWIGWLVAAAAMGFLVMTRSKTSLALFPVALLAGLAYRACWRDGLSRAIFVSAAALLVLVAGGGGHFLCRCHLPRAGGSHRIHRPRRNLAGRSRLYARSSLAGRRLRHPRPTPAACRRCIIMSARSWVEAIGDSHDGYLQILVTTGRRRLCSGAWSSLVLEPLAALLAAGLPADRLQGPAFRPVRLFCPAQFHGVGFSGA